MAEKRLDYLSLKKSGGGDLISMRFCHFPGYFKEL
jgi:hypothetical protein